MSSIVTQEAEDLSQKGRVFRRGRESAINKTNHPLKIFANSETMGNQLKTHD